ncbi:MAG: hypothetical protein F6K36_14935 [Symploca sp. SIO3C6]|nr:hypothetical protein [Symploca sp. SIO3C6]
MKTILSLSYIFTEIQHNYPDERVLLIADQFEELYTLCIEEEISRNFLEVLLSCFPSSNSKQSSSNVLVTTMRADFLVKALSYRPFADRLQETDIKLGPMSREELTEVIEQPVKKLGFKFEVGLAERILNDVEDEPGNLPLLEFALTKLWEKQAGKQLTHDAYEAIGQVKRALAKYAKDKYDKLTSKEQEQAQRIFVQLVYPGEGNKHTRRRANRAELGEDNWHLVTCNEGLADSRLVVTSVDDAKQETVEIVHEALIQNWDDLQKWIENDRKFRTWQEGLRFAIRQWQQSGKDKGALLRGRQLFEAKDWLQRRRIDLEAEREYIEVSVEERNVEIQRELKRTT